jgi:hypothetical protein
MIYLIVGASDFSEKWIPLSGPMLKWPEPRSSGFPPGGPGFKTI